MTNRLKQTIYLASLISIIIGNAANAKGLEYREFDVRFTNPKCATYVYPEPISNQNGDKTLYQKPQDAYCSRLDTKQNSGTPGTPSEKLGEWIYPENPKDSPEEIFFTFLSWSNSFVTNKLCDAVNNRGVKITATISSDSDEAKWEEFKECVHEDKQDLITLMKRGQAGGIGYAHNKTFIFNPNNTKEKQMKFTFGSANLSGGVQLHHENWNFVDVKRNSYFAQAHLCLMNGMIESGKSKKAYSDFLKKCLDEAAEKYEPEDDISVYFVPSYSAYEVTERVAEKISDPNTEEILIAAHRFSYWNFIEPLRDRLSYNSSAPTPTVKMLFDDDIFWLQTTKEKVGDNTPNEARYVSNLERFGAETRFIETNHHGEHYLHHNKIMIFNTHNHRYDPETKKWREASLDQLKQDGAAVLTGAANFTHPAYGDKGSTPNFENIYYITIPEIAKKYKEQYVHLYYDLGTPPEDMPEWDQAPERKSK